MALLGSESIPTLKFRIRPEKLYLHVDGPLPECPFCRLARSYFDAIRTWQVPETNAAGQKFASVQHKAEVLRLVVLYIIMLRSLEGLVDFEGEFAMGLQLGSPGSREKERICSGLIIARLGSTFIRLWRQGYDTNYEPDKYAFNGQDYPSKLMLKHPGLVHTPPQRFFHSPSWVDRETFLGLPPYLSNFSENYGVYLWNSQLGHHLEGLTLSDIVHGNQSFCRLLRPLLPNPFLSVRL